MLAIYLTVGSVLQVITVSKAAFIQLPAVRDTLVHRARRSLQRVLLELTAQQRLLFHNLVLKVSTVRLSELIFIPSAKTELTAVSVSPYKPSVQLGTLEPALPGIIMRQSVALLVDLANIVIRGLTSVSPARQATSVTVML